MQLKQRIKSHVKYALAHLGCQINSIKTFPTWATDKDTLQSLIDSLSPQSTDKKLIRMGPEGDGGYLVPDDLNGVLACFSPGVSTGSGFEKDCADLGIRVFLADNSVENPVDSHDRFFFSKKHVGVTTNDDFTTIDDWVSTSLPESQGDLILQIDIEGYEYETFLSMSDRLLSRFRIIVAEFHTLDQLWNGPFYQLASRAFEKILQTHRCVHIHPNNSTPSQYREGLFIPPTLEFTFLRKDRILKSSTNHSFPHPLDSDNSAHPSLTLPKCWHSTH